MYLLFFSMVYKKAVYFTHLALLIEYSDKLWLKLRYKKKMDHRDQNFSK